MDETNINISNSGSYKVDLANEINAVNDQTIVTALLGLIIISFCLAVYFFVTQSSQTDEHTSPAVTESQEHQAEPDTNAQNENARKSKKITSASRTLEIEVIEPNTATSRTERVDEVLARTVVMSDAGSDNYNDKTGMSILQDSTTVQQSVKTTPALTENDKRRQKNQVKLFCAKLGEKLGSVSVSDCLQYGFIHSGMLSNEKTPIVYLDYGSEQKDATKVLLFGGIHGDEFSAISVVFRWLKYLESEYVDTGEKNIHWRVVPVLNPDGLLQPDGKSKRMNANNVDLNRNFPTPDWQQDALKYWKEKTGENERRYPGQAPASEIETLWVLDQLDEFDPDAVISVHAPFGIVDADGPAEPPQKLGPLELKLLGTYPGSMGRYIGVHKNLPMLTVELERAGSMPKQDDIEHIWLDIQDWIADKVQDRDDDTQAEMQSLRRLETDDNGSTVIDKKGGD